MFVITTKKTFFLFICGRFTNRNVRPKTLLLTLPQAGALSHPQIIIGLQKYAFFINQQLFSIKICVFYLILSMFYDFYMVLLRSQTKNYTTFCELSYRSQPGISK